MRRILAISTLLASALLVIAPGPLALADRSDDAGSLKFKGSSFPVKEEAGEVRIVVRRHRGSEGEISVEFTTVDGSALAGEDYMPVAGTLTWRDGEKKDKTFLVPIIDDDEPEGVETFGVVLSNPTGEVEIGRPSSTSVRIKPSDRNEEDSDSEDSDSEDSDSDSDSDDEDDPGCLRLTKMNFIAFESSGEASFTVERDDGDFGEVSVDYELIDGSAVSPDDYLSDSGTLTWADGEDGEMTVTVDLVDDTEEEEDETITVVLSNATGGACLGRRDNASIVIVDDDGGDGSCIADENTACLHDGRFQVTGSWEDFDGNQGDFHFVPMTDHTGLVWFFNEDNIELLIKVLNGCALNQHFWVFFAATTNVGFTLEVTDLETGQTRTYTNPLGVIPQATTDVTAFPTCN